MAGAIGLHPRDEPWGDVTCHLRGLALKAHHCSKVRPRARHLRVHCSLQSCDRDVRGWGAGGGELSQSTGGLCFSCKPKRIPQQKGERDSREGSQPGGEGGGLSAPAAVGRAPRPTAGQRGGHERCWLPRAMAPRTTLADTRGPHSWACGSRTVQLPDQPRAPRPAAPSPAPASGAHLKLQEGDVEEPVQVLEAEAVLHGGLGVAKVRGSRGPVHRRADRRG